MRTREMSDEITVWDYVRGLVCLAGLFGTGTVIFLIGVAVR